MSLSPGFAEVVFWLALATVAVAQLGILRATLRARAVAAENGGQTPEPQRQRRFLELLWALIPALALIFVFAGSWKAMHQRVSDASEQVNPNPPATISVTPTLLAAVPAPTPRIITPTPRPTPAATQVFVAEEVVAEEFDDEMQPR